MYVVNIDIQQLVLASRPWCLQVGLVSNQQSSLSGGSPLVPRVVQCFNLCDSVQSPAAALLSNSKTNFSVCVTVKQVPCATASPCQA